MINRIKYAREGGNVTRCHTHMDIKEDMVNKHTFNMLTMLMILYPDARPALIWAVLQHDIPERDIGDTPYPAKRAGVINRQVVADLEIQINRSVSGKDYAITLEEFELKWLYGLDMVEYYMFCLDELSYGNRNVVRSIHKVEKLMKQNRHLYPEKLNAIMIALGDYEWVYGPAMGDEDYGQF